MSNSISQRVSLIIFSIWLLPISVTAEPTLSQIVYPIPSAGAVEASNTYGGQGCINPRTQAAILGYDQQPGAIININPIGGDKDLCPNSLMWAITPFQSCISATASQIQQAKASKVSYSLSNLQLTFTTASSAQYSMSTPSNTILENILCPQVTKTDDTGTATLNFAGCAQDLNEAVIVCCWTPDGNPDGCNF